MPADLRAASVVTEAELRRYLRHASVLLATSEPPPLQAVEQRLAILRRACHWIEAARLGVEQLLREIEADTLDEPLTIAPAASTIEADP